MIKVLEENFPDIREEHLATLVDEAILEGYEIEYKKEFIKGIGKSVASFANSSGGWIVIGVETQDNAPKKLTPQKLSGNAHDTLEDRCTSPNINPNCVFDHIIVDSGKADKQYIVIKIPESFNSPHLYKGRIYVRTGAKSEPVVLENYDQIARMFRLKRERVEGSKSKVGDTLKNIKQKIRTFNSDKSAAEKVTYLTVACFTYPLRPGIFDYIYQAEYATSLKAGAYYLPGTQPTFIGECLAFVSSLYPIFGLPETMFGVYADGIIIAFSRIESRDPRYFTWGPRIPERTRFIEETYFDRFITQAFEFSRNVLEIGDFKGEVGINVCVEGVLGYSLMRPADVEYYQDNTNVYCAEEGFITPDINNPYIIDASGLSSGKSSEKIIKALSNSISRWFRLPVFES